MEKVNKNIKNSDALKGFLFRAYNARRCKSVGQVLPDNKQNLIKNNSCVVGPEQQLLRTSALFNCQVEPDLHTHHRVSPSLLVGEGARRAGEGFSQGFTLIELLVVVLIIGILSAVALPQYQRAVARARATRMIALLSNYTKALDLYVLQNGYQNIDFVNVSGGEITTFSDTLDLQFSKSEVQEIANYYQQNSEDSFFLIRCENDEDYPYCMISSMGGEKVEFNLGREVGQNKWVSVNACNGFDLDGEILCDILEEIY